LRRHILYIITFKTLYDVDREKNEVCSGGFAGEFQKSLYLHNVYRDKMKFVLVAAGLLLIVNYVRKSPGLQHFR